MKYTRILLFISILTVSGIASAEFFEGFDKNKSVGQSTETGQGYTSTEGQGSGTGSSNASGWGQGKGNADGAVDFSVTFKGKGSTDMASDVYGSGDTNTNLSSYANGYALGYNNLYGASNAYTNSAPWSYYGGVPGYNYYGYGTPYYGYNPMMMGYSYPVITQAPSFDQVQRQMLPQTTPAPTN